MVRWIAVFAPVALALTAAPAQARDTSQELARAAEILDDPATQDRIATSLSGLFDALMQMPVGPLAKAVRDIDPDADVADIPADAVVGDLAARGNPDFAENLDADIRTSTRMAGTMAKSLVTLAPVLEAMARDLESQFEGAIAEGRRARR